MGFYPNAKSTHIPLSPAKVGLEKIGHFGFFDKRMADHLWPRITEWLRRTVTEVAKEIALEELIEARAIGKIRTPSNAKVLAANLRKTIHEKIAEQEKAKTASLPVVMEAAPAAAPAKTRTGLAETASRLLGGGKSRTTAKTPELIPAASMRAPALTEEYVPDPDLSPEDVEENSRAARRAARRQRQRTVPDVKVPNPGPQTEYPSPSPQRPPATDQQA